MLHTLKMAAMAFIEQCHGCYLKVAQSNGTLHIYACESMSDEVKCPLLQL